MPETTPLIKAALNLRGGAGFDVYGFDVYAYSLRQYNSRKNSQSPFHKRTLATIVSSYKNSAVFNNA